MAFFRSIFSILSLKVWIRLFWLFVFLAVCSISFSIAHILSQKRLHSLPFLMDMPFASGFSALFFDHVRSTPMPYDHVPLDSRFIYTDIMAYDRLTPSLFLYRLSVRLDSSSFCCLLLLVDTHTFQKKELLLITEHDLVQRVSTASSQHFGIMVGHLDTDSGIFTTRYDFFVPDEFSLRPVFSTLVYSNASLFPADKEGYIHENVVFSYVPTEKTPSNPYGYPIIHTHHTHHQYGGRVRHASPSYIYDGETMQYIPTP